MAQTRIQHLQAAAATEGPTRLRHLLAAWRTARSPALANAIEALSASLDAPRPRIAGKTGEARLATWLAVEAEGDEVLRGWLLASPALGDTLTPLYEPRLRRVAKWAPDPRLASALAALFENPPFANLASLWDPVVKQLIACADTRTKKTLLKWRDDWWGKFFSSRIDKIVAALDKHPDVPLTAAEKKLLGTNAKPNRTDEKALLAAIYAAPADDGPRLVYADYLTERGDVRGELISLQCNKTDRARMQQLLRDHKAKWLGPIGEAILEVQPYTFERGFLATATVCAMSGTNPREQDERDVKVLALSNHPAWATLRRVKMAKIATTTRKELLAHLARLGVEVVLG